MTMDHDSLVESLLCGLDTSNRVANVIEAILKTDRLILIGLNSRSPDISTQVLTIRGLAFIMFETVLG